MARLNLTLDDDTDERLTRHAAASGAPKAATARVLLLEALDNREAEARATTLAADYEAGVEENRALAAKLQGGQLDLVGDEDD